MQRSVQVAGREGAGSNWPLLIVSGIRSRRVDPPVLTPPLWGPVQGGEGDSRTSPPIPASIYVPYACVGNFVFTCFFFLILVIGVVLYLQVPQQSGSRFTFKIDS